MSYYSFLLTSVCWKFIKVFTRMSLILTEMKTTFYVRNILQRVSIDDTDWCTWKIQDLYLGFKSNLTTHSEQMYVRCYIKCKADRAYSLLHGTLFLSVTVFLNRKINIHTKINKTYEDSVSIILIQIYEGWLTS